MTGSLRGDPKAMRARELDDLYDIVSGLDQSDRGRPLIDGEIPGLASLVPLRIARKHEPAGETVPQGVESVELTVRRYPGVIHRVPGVSAVGHERDAIPSMSGVLRHRHQHDSGRAMPVWESKAPIEGSALFSTDD